MGTENPEAIRAFAQVRGGLGSLLAVRALLGGEGRGILVTAAENRRYLSGFRGTAGALVIGPEGQSIVVDGRYRDQAEEHGPDFRVVLGTGRLLRDAVTEARRLGIRECSFEAQDVTVLQYEELARAADAEGVTLVPADDPVGRLRRVKTDAELDRMRAAARIASAAFEHAARVIRPGVSERTVAWEVERFMREAGAEAIKGNHVIASGPRGALPHGQATDRVLASGDLITLDIGARVDGYYSDMTRTFGVGRVDARARDVYRLVQEAQAMALERVRAGAVCADVDAAVRARFAEHGVADRFAHGLGHGIGLELHEQPRLAPGDRTVLEPNMVTSVEPGLYFPGWGGVRIEDLVVVREDGIENLCAFPKDLIEL